MYRLSQPHGGERSAVSGAHPQYVGNSVTFQFSRKERAIRGRVKSGRDSRLLCSLLCRRVGEVQRERNRRGKSDRSPVCPVLYKTVQRYAWDNTKVGLCTYTYMYMYPSIRHIKRNCVRHLTNNLLPSSACATSQSPVGTTT